MSLSRDAFLAAIKPRVEQIEAPGVGPVYVRTLGAGRVTRFVDAIEAANKKKGTTETVDALLEGCVAMLCDEDGKALFTDGDIEQLRDLSLADLQAIFDAGLRLNGFTDDTQAELEKN